MLIKSESRYPVSRKTIKDVVGSVLMVKRIKGDVEVSVNVVGDRLMKALNKKYRNIDTSTDVLSFSLSESQGNKPFMDVPDGILRLGDIVISYPQAVFDAAEEDKLVDQKIKELVEHGLLHLLGEHHE